MTATMMARLPRNATMAENPLTVARRTSLAKAAVSFLIMPTHLGSPQIVVWSSKRMLETSTLTAFQVVRLKNAEKVNRIKLQEISSSEVVILLLSKG